MLLIGYMSFGRCGAAAIGDCISGCCYGRRQNLIGKVGQCRDVILEWNLMATAFSSGALEDHRFFSGCRISDHSKQPPKK